jgi:hypothetical protein
MSNSNNIVNNDNEINWSEVLKKEARGINESDFGEVQEIALYYILTERGLINKDKFYLPRELVEGFDGDKLRFAISEEDAEEKFKRDTPPSSKEYTIFKKKNNSKDSKHVEKKRGNKKITNSFKTNLSDSKEAENHSETNSEQSKDTDNLTTQKKKSKQKNDKKQKDEIINKEKEDKARQEVEDKARIEAEKRAQSIAQQIQDKAKMEGERKSHSIIQQAEEKARQEAEKRAREISKEVEDKARIEAEKRADGIRDEIEQKVNKEAEEKSHSIIQQAEEKARQEAEKRAREISKEVEDKARIEAENKSRSEINTTKVIDHSFQEEGSKFEKDDQRNEFFNPFFAGIEIWQNYSIYWINKSKEIYNTATSVSKDFGNNLKKNWTINPVYDNDNYQAKIE